MTNLNSSFVYVKSYVFPIGTLDIGVKNDKVILVGMHEAFSSLYNDSCPLGEKTAQELKEYFAKKRKVFDVPISFEESQFSTKVYDKLLKVGYGETISYGKLASLAGRPLGARAVGKVLHNNPLLILVPCHRVVGHDGSLTGFIAGNKTKKELLDLEKNNSI
jgi:methylated-DNA-[protein]-cysteine S-methyltransferase